MLDPAQPIPFSISSTTSSLAFDGAEERSFDVQVEVKAPLKRQLTVEAYGAPSKITFTPAPQVIAAGAPGSYRSTVRVVATGDAPEGVYPIALSVTDGQVTQVLPLNLSVTRTVNPILTGPTLLVIAAVAALFVGLGVWWVRRSKLRLKLKTGGPDVRGSSPDRGAG